MGGCAACIAQSPDRSSKRRLEDGKRAGLSLEPDGCPMRLSANPLVARRAVFVSRSEFRQVNVFDPHVANAAEADRAPGSQLRQPPESRAEPLKVLFDLSRVDANATNHTVELGGFPVLEWRIGHHQHAPLDGPRRLVDLDPAQQLAFGLGMRMHEVAEKEQAALAVEVGILRPRTEPSRDGGLKSLAILQVFDRVLDFLEGQRSFPRTSEYGR